jgi:hypothetical protein
MGAKGGLCLTKQSFAAFADGFSILGSTVPIFAAENSPAQIRGALVMGWQLWASMTMLRFPHEFTDIFFF